MSKLVAIARRLAKEADALTFEAPVSYVYNPLSYAWKSHRRYLIAYDDALPVSNILVGMNPGPFGMAQTGVPFGEVNIVRDWLGIEESVGTPPREHPKRPVQGFDCHRSEVSGARLWGWAQQRFRTPKQFMREFFIYNYCPLAFLEATGRNRTPDKLPADEREALYAVCDRAFCDVVKAVQPKRIIGIGAFAQQRAKAALGTDAPPIFRILHPSPASPVANRGWAKQAEAQLKEIGLQLPKASRAA